MHRFLLNSFFMFVFFVSAFSFKASALTIFAGSGTDSLTMNRVSLTDEKFTGTPMIFGLGFEQKKKDSPWSFFTWIQGEMNTRTGSASDKMSGTVFQFGGGLRFEIFYIKGGIHYGTQTLTEASGTALSYNDRGSHAAAGIEIPLTKRISIQVEEQAQFVSLNGAGDSTFSPSYAGQYLRTVAYLVFNIGGPGSKSTSGGGGWRR